MKNFINFINEDVGEKENVWGAFSVYDDYGGWDYNGLRFIVKAKNEKEARKKGLYMGYGDSTTGYLHFHKLSEKKCKEVIEKLDQKIRSLDVTKKKYTDILTELENEDSNFEEWTEEN